MRSTKQRETSRINGAKSKGPTTPEGKDKSKFNGLKHGLRAKQVVLPGESEAEFKAEFKGFADDWSPAGHTEAVFVERAAVASWRLRRCVRAERDAILELAARAREDDRPAVADVDDLDARLDRAEAKLDRGFEEATAELRKSPEGIDRLLARWDDAHEAARDRHDDWTKDDHAAVMVLLGHSEYDDPGLAGPVGVAAARLRVANGGDVWEDEDLAFDDDGKRVRPEPAPPADLQDTEVEAERLRREIDRERQALRALRDDRAAADDEEDAEDEDDGEAVAVAFTGVPRELMLIHRYEMGIERQFRGTIKDLMALQKAKAATDKGREKKTELVVANTVMKSKAEPSADPSPARTAAPSEPEPVADSVTSGGPRRAPAAPPRRRRRRRAGRSRR
jgi:hypothetical protein